MYVDDDVIIERLRSICGLGPDDQYTVDSAIIKLLEYNVRPKVERRLVGFRRTVQSFISLYNTVVIDGILCDGVTRQPHTIAAFVPVYEGDPGWEEVEAETKSAEMRN